MPDQNSRAILANSRAKIHVAKIHALVSRHRSIFPRRLPLICVSTKPRTGLSHVAQQRPSPIKKTETDPGRKNHLTKKITLQLQSLQSCSNQM